MPSKRVLMDISRNVPYTTPRGEGPPGDEPDPTKRAPESVGFRGRNRARPGGLRVRGQGSGSTSRDPSIGPGPPGRVALINPFLRVRYDLECDESRTVNRKRARLNPINPKI